MGEMLAASHKRECVKEILHTERNWRTIIKKVNEDLFWNAFSSANCALERCWGHGAKMEQVNNSRLKPKAFIYRNCKAIRH